VIVLDASAAVDWLIQTSAGRSIERRIYSRNETLHAPQLLDLEESENCHVFTDDWDGGP